MSTNCLPTLGKIQHYPLLGWSESLDCNIRCDRDENFPLMDQSRYFMKNPTSGNFEWVKGFRLKYPFMHYKMSGWAGAE